MAKWEITLEDGSTHIAEGESEAEARRSFETGNATPSTDAGERIDKILGSEGGGEKKSGRPMLKDAVAEARGDIPRVMSQINEDAIAGTLGMPVDAAAAALRFTGLPIGDEPVGGSKWMVDIMRRSGASSAVRPKTATGEMIAGAGGGALEGALSGGGIGAGVKKLGERVAKPALEKTGEIISNVRGNVAAGAGGGVGEEAGRSVGRGTPMEKPLDILGQVGGGFLAGMLEPAAALRPPRQRVPDPVISTYERLKLAPSAAESGIGGRGVEWLQGNILPQTIGGGNVMENFRQQRMRDLENIQEGIASAFGDVKPREEMGADIKANVMDTWNQVKQKDGQIIGGLKAKYGTNDVYAGELVNAVANPTGAAASAGVREQTLDPLIGKAAELIRENGGIFKFSDLAALKTAYGNAMEPGFQKNVNDAQVSQLFKAVKDDMESYIRMTSPEDYRTLKESNRRYAEGEKNFRAHFKKLVGTGDVPVSAERAYEIVAQSANEKGRANMEQFRQVWDTLSPTVRGNLTATILGRMGVNPPSNAGNWERWQLGKFLTEYRTLSPEAKDMLFEKQPKVREAWDDLATVSDNIQKRMLKLASSSRSGTGALVLGQFGLGGIMGHLTEGSWFGVQAALWGVGGPWGAAHLLTDPKMVRALTATIDRLGNGLDGAGRAMIDLSALPKAGKAAVIPQQIVDETPSVPISQ